MLAKAASILVILIVFGHVQSQDNGPEIWIPRKVCAMVPFKYSCPDGFVMSVRSITFYSSYTESKPVKAANNTTCPPTSFDCSRTFRDPNDEGMRDDSFIYTFYKLIISNCQTKQVCSGTLLAPNWNGITKICTEVDVAYLVAALLDLLCVTNIASTTFALLHGSTTRHTQQPLSLDFSTKHTSNQVNNGNAEASSSSGDDSEASLINDHTAVTTGLSVALVCVTCLLLPPAIIFIRDRCKRSRQNGSRSLLDPRSRQTPGNDALSTSSSVVVSPPPEERTCRLYPPFNNNLVHNFLPSRQEADEPPPYEEACNYSSSHCREGMNQQQA